MTSSGCYRNIVIALVGSTRGLSTVGANLSVLESPPNVRISRLIGRMGVRQSISYSRFAGTNQLHIGLTSVTAGRHFRVRNRNVDASCRATA